MTSLTPPVQTGELLPEAHPRRLLLPVLATVGASLCTLAYGDHELAKHSNQRLPTEGEMVVHDNAAPQNIITLVGHRVMASTMSELLEPSLGELANTAYIGYAKRGNSVERVKESVLRAKDALDGSLTTSFYLHSMGGPLWINMFKDKAFQEAFGPVKKVVFDSSPASLSDVGRGPRFALRVAGVAQNSTTMNIVTRTYLQQRALQLAAPYKQSPRYEHILKNRMATARMELAAIACQRPFLEDEQLGDVSGVADSYDYVQAERDHIVTTDRSFKRINMAVGGNLKRTIDYDRPLVSHAAGSEHPTLITRLLTS